MRKPADSLSYAVSVLSGACGILSAAAWSMAARTSARLTETIWSQGLTSLDRISPELTPARIATYRLTGLVLLIVGMAAALSTWRLKGEHRSVARGIGSLTGMFGGVVGLVLAAVFLTGPDVEPMEAVELQRERVFFARCSAIIAASGPASQHALAPDALDRPVVWLRSVESVAAIRQPFAWTYSVMTPPELRRSVGPCIVVVIRDEAVPRFEYTKIPPSPADDGGESTDKGYQDVWHVTAFRWPEGDYLGSDTITATPPDVVNGQLTGNDILGPAHEWLYRHTPPEAARAGSATPHEPR